MSNNIATGIDVGTSSIRVVVAERQKEDAVPKILGVGIAESRGLRHGYVVNPADATKSIRKAVMNASKEAKINIKEAFISIGGISLEANLVEGSAIISRADGEITDIDIKNVIASSEEKFNNTNHQVIHTIPIRYRLDGKEIMGKPNGLKGIKFEVDTLFISSLQQHLSDLIHVVEDAGIAVEDIMASPIAASLVTLTRQQKTAGCLLANIGSETVSICVFENNIPISMQVFPIGATDITNDIALGLKISLEDAERVKLGQDLSMYPKKKLDNIIEARLSDIFELIESHLKKIRRNGLLPAGVIITGGGAGISNIEDLAKSALKLPAKIGNSYKIINSENQIKDASWSVAYGLCIWGLDAETEPSGMQFIKNTKSNLASWIKQFLP